MSALALLHELETLGIAVWREGDELCVRAPAGRLTDRLRRAIRDGKADLLSALAAREIRRVERDRLLPASFAQSRLWFLHQLDPTSSAYNLPSAKPIDAAVDEDALERAVRELVARHETLRTTFEAIDGEPHQLIHPAVDIRLRRIQVASEGEARAAVLEEMHAPFDLASGPVVRVTLVRVRDDQAYFVLNVHHIVTDGTGWVILSRELWELYRAFAAGRPSPLPALAFGYADFSVWQRAWLTGSLLESHLAFWRGHLAGAPAAIDLPTDRPRPPIKQTVGASVHFEIPPGVSKHARAFCKREGVTPFMLLFAAFACVLARWSRQKDVVVGTPIANRTRAELQGIVGFFVNTLSLRVTFDGEPSFRELVQRVKEVAFEAYNHQDLPFEKLVDALGVVRDTSRTPLFQVMFGMQNFAAKPERHDESVQARDDGETQPRSGEGIAFEAAQCDLSLVMREETDRFSGSMLYDVALFDRETVERFVSHFLVLFEAAATSPETRVAALPLMIEAERQRVLFEWNAATRSTDEPRCVNDLFHEQVAKTPSALAVEDERGGLTYASLAARSLAFAEQLAASGVRRGDVVALYLPGGVDAVVAMLAVLEVGAAYLPLDVKEPEERLRQLLVDSHARAVVALDGASASKLHDVVVSISELARVPSRGGSRSPAAPQDLAYIIYTSGSTGAPKAVCIGHDTLSAMARSAARSRGAGENSRFSQYANLAFDAHVWEIWPALVSGASVHFVPEAMRLDVSALVAWIAKSRLTWCFLPTPVAEECLLLEWPACELVTLTVAGDRLHGVPNARYPFLLENYYGPSECTCVATGAGIEPGDEHPSIGRPFPGVAVYVLDRSLEPTPTGVLGELCIGGDLVGRGYFERPALTAEKFVPDPFARTRGARMYRTGDLVRWRSDGTLDFVGRIDDQVKIRGFRIEPGEVESALGKLPGVSTSVVIAREDAPGEKRLVAYVVPMAGVDVRAEPLKAALSQRLPERMVPSAFVFLGELPLTANGKVDRKALPAPDFAASAEVYVAPRDGVEEVLAGIFREVLGVERVGVHDDFFALGGHSLLATRLASRVRATLSVELPIRTVFEAPTVAALARRAREATDGSIGTTLTRAERSGPLPASYAQSRLWFLDQLEPGSAAYNVPLALRVAGPLDVDALERAVRELVARHEVLRTTFVAIDGEPHQVVHAAFDVPLHRLSASSEEEGSELVTREVNTPFDLANGPVVRATLVQVGEALHLFVLNIHHIATDGWSAGILTREISVLYEAFAHGKPSSLSAPAFGYADFAVWQRAQLTPEVVEGQLTFWREHLRGAPAALELPLDRPRPAVKQYKGARIRVQVPAELSREVKALCAREGVTPFMLLLAAYQCVLSRWSGQKDVVVGTPIANRTSQELEGIVGFFVNTLALRTSFEGAPSFRELLQRVRTAALEAYAHQDIPFEKLVDALGVVRDTSRTPVFQAMFAMQNVGADAALRLGEAVVSSATGAFEVSKFDLTLFVVDAPGGFSASLEYDVALFDRSTIERMAVHFGVLLEAAAASPDTAVSRMPLLGAAERRKLLVEWSTTASTDEPRCIHDLFHEQAARTPDALAVKDEDGALTYATLETRALALAEHLASRGVRRGDVVALYVPRSTDAIVGMLAILEIGATYLALDTKQPEARLRQLLADSRARVVVARDAAPASNLCEVVVELADVPHAPSRARPRWPVAPQDRAYIIYTSGSTGTPKGVCVGHDTLSMMARAEARTRVAGAQRRFSQYANLAFDSHVWEIWPALLSGASVNFIPDAIRLDLPELVKWIAGSGVGWCFLPTPIAEPCLELEWPPCELATLAVAGDALHGVPSKRFPFRVENHYGPSECTCETSSAVIEPGDPRPSIGRPIPGVSAYVLDRSLEPVPIGVLGELYIGGAQVGQGYLDRPALTAERFVPDPFASKPGARLYRTGDLARFRPDSTLEFAGRADHQVKIRGNRIELGEIEAVLGSLPGVARSVVVAREDTPSAKRLAAYVVAESGGELSIDELRGELGRRLPDYMVPSAFIVLDALPLTPNGKVDRKALPVPDFTASTEAYVAARSPQEETLVEIWQNVLGVPRVGVHDNFFALGGHSLLAMRMTARAREVFGRDMPVRMVFTSPTIAELAKELSRESEELSLPPITPTQATTVPVLSYCQDIFVAFERDRRPSSTWTTPLRLRLRGPLDRRALREAIQLLAARQEALRLTVDFRSKDAPRFCSPEDIDLRLVDMRGRSDAEVQALCDEGGARAFAGGPLISFDLIERSAEDHVLLVVFHQLVHDGAAAGLFVRDLRELYASRVEKREPRLPALALRYVDYAIWQKRWYEEGPGQAAVEAARKPLDGLRGLQLPTDHPRRGHVSPACFTNWFGLDKESSGRFFELCRSMEVTPFMGFGAVTAAFLAKWSEQAEIAFLAPVNLRALVPSMQDVFGRFVNFTVVSIFVGDDPSLAELLRRARAATLAAYAHSQTPAALVLGTPLIYDHPLTRVLLNSPEVSTATSGPAVRAAEPNPSELSISIERVAVPSGARNDVAIVLAGSPEGIYGAVRGATDLFEPSTIERKSKELASVVRSLDLEQRISQLRWSAD